MWTNISREDIQRAQAELTHNHFQTDLRHAEEFQVLQKRQQQERDELEARIIKLEAVERDIEAFVQEYLLPNKPNTVNTRPREVEVVATWEKTKPGFRAA
jgi:hypothetical protein